MGTKNLTAFQALGPTILVASDATAPSGAATSSSGMAAEPIIQFRIHNSGTVMVSYAYGATAAAALAAAVVPTGSSSNAKSSFPLPAGAVEVISAPRDSYWSSISASAVSVFITPGVGA